MCENDVFFLPVNLYSRCGAPASWAARHTIVCLDYTKLSMDFYIVKIKLATI